MLGEMILKHSKNLSSIILCYNISLYQGQYITQMMNGTLKSACTDDSFDLFWQKVNSKASELDNGKGGEQVVKVGRGGLDL